MKHKAVRTAGASCPCTDLHHFLARVNVAGGTSGACDLHGRLLLAICTCLLNFGYPRLQCCLTAALPTVWATFANLRDMGCSGCSRQSCKLPSPMWDRQSPPRAHTRIMLSHRLPCDHSSLHLYHLPRFARFPGSLALCLCTRVVPRCHG
jgi:hypothetical protein